MSKSRYSAIGILLLLCLFFMSGPFPSGTAGAESITWKEKYYNPKPLPHDLILPMRCGGAMVFRPVIIPSNSTLDDRLVELGHVDEDHGYKEGRRLSYIAGAFSDGADEPRRVYYLSKYETTRDQYAAIMDEACPNPSTPGRLPVVNVSWFDAVNFAQRFTEWLIQHAREKLPFESKEPGFLRLPTEEEWEFAARGGLVVDDAEFVAPVFPMPDGDLAQYAWYSSTQSAGGELRPAGLLKPNPLGLFDILGNAAEMVFVPFHLDHRGRLHGQAGGFVTRGGDIFTPYEQIRSAERQEYNYFDTETGQAKFLDTIGFRLAITAPIIVSHDRLKRIKQDWAQLPAMTGKAGENAEQALEELRNVTARTKDSALRAKLELIGRDVEKLHTEIKESRERTIRALIRMGAFLGNRISIDHINARGIKEIISLAKSKLERLKLSAQGEPKGAEIIKEAETDVERKLGEWQERLGEAQKKLNISLSYYSDMVINVARDYDERAMDGQFEMVRVEFETKNTEYLIPYGQLFIGHISKWRREGKAEKSAWLEDILALERR